MDLILASSSPRRSQILGDLGLAFKTVRPELDERPNQGEDPLAFVRRIALEKAEKVSQELSSVIVPENMIIAADTVVILRKRLLGKAANREEAKEMLSLLRGQRHYVVTSLSLLHSQEELRRKAIAHSVSSVTFWDFPDPMLEAYLNTGEWQGKAGAYAVQGKGSYFVQSFQGSLSNIIGFPLRLFFRMLAGLEIEPTVLYKKK